MGVKGWRIVRVRSSNCRLSGCYADLGQIKRYIYGGLKARKQKEDPLTKGFLFLE